MPITDILANAQGGHYFSSAAATAGTDEATARVFISAVAPVIAARLRDKSKADPEAFEELLDLLEDEDGSALNDRAASTGAEAVADGREILSDLFGGQDAAISALSTKAPKLPREKADTLSAISATGVLAALGAANAAALHGGGAQAAQSTSGGLLSIIIAALLKGLLQGASRQLAPRRRRRRYTSYFGKRRPARRTRKRAVGLDDVFREILGGGR